MRFIWIAAAAIGGTVGGMLALFLVWQYSESRIIPVTLVAAEAENYIVRPGDIARMRLVFYRERSCYTRSDADWKYSDGERHPIRMRDWPRGQLPLGHDVTSRSELVPLDAPEGELLFEATNTFACNLIGWPTATSAPRVVRFWVQRD